MRYIVAVLTVLCVGSLFAEQAQAQMNAISSCRRSKAELKHLEEMEKAQKIDAIIEMALLYKEGLCFPANKVKSMGLLKRAANMGSVDALYELAQIYRLPTGNDDKNEEHQEITRNLYLQASNLGHVKAQFELGEFYIQGKKGWTQSTEQALHWYKTAAKNNNMKAARRVAQLYQTGEGGIPTNAIIAEQWLRGAAKSGDVFAIQDLAAYLLKVDKQKNIQEVINLYEYLAKQGLHSVGEPLGDLYMDLQQEAVAYYWYILAMKYGAPTGKKAKELEWKLGDLKKKNAFIKVQKFRKEYPAFNRYFE